MERYSGEAMINVGAGKAISIAELATVIADVVGYRGSIHWDSAKPDGTPRKLLDVTRISSLGWSPKISFRQGIHATYEWYRRTAAGNRVSLTLIERGKRMGIRGRDNNP